MGLIQLEDVYFAYDEEDVLKNIKLTVTETNGCILLVGENGSGKSTLMNVICGFLKPYRGEVKTEGTLAYLPFRNPLFPQLTVKENLRYFYRCFQGKELQLQDEEVQRILDTLHIDYLEQRMMKCSSGQKQKAALAVILLSNAPIILLDEPFVAVDAESITAIITLLQEMSKDRLFIMTSHTLLQTRKAVTRLICLKDGEITADTTDIESINTFYRSRMEKELC